MTLTSSSFKRCSRLGGGKAFVLPYLESFLEGNLFGGYISVSTTAFFGALLRVEESSMSIRMNELVGAFDEARAQIEEHLAAEVARAKAFESRALIAEGLVNAFKLSCEGIATADDRHSAFARDVSRAAEIEAALLSRVESVEAALSVSRALTLTARGEAAAAAAAALAARADAATCVATAAMLQSALTAALAEADATSSIAKEQSLVISRLAARLSTKTGVAAVAAAVPAHVPPPLRPRLVRADGRAAAVHFYSGEDDSSPVA